MPNLSAEEAEHRLKSYQRGRRDGRRDALRKVEHLYRLGLLLALAAVAWALLSTLPGAVSRLADVVALK